MQLLVEGKSARQIATALRVPETAIEASREKVMRKLGLETHLALTRYAIREGLVALDP